MRRLALALLAALALAGCTNAFVDPTPEGCADTLVEGGCEGGGDVGGCEDQVDADG